MARVPSIHLTDSQKLDYFHGVGRSCIHCSHALPNNYYILTLNNCESPFMPNSDTFFQHSLFIPQIRGHVRYQSHRSSFKAYDTGGKHITFLVSSWSLYSLVLCPMQLIPSPLRIEDRAFICIRPFIFIAAC